MSVLGAGGVYIVDLQASEVSYDSGNKWQITNVVNHYLKSGDSFDPSSGVAYINSEINESLSLRDSNLHKLIQIPSDETPYKIGHYRTENFRIAHSDAYINSVVQIIYGLMPGRISSNYCDKVL